MVRGGEEVEGEEEEARRLSEGGTKFCVAARCRSRRFLALAPGDAPLDPTRVGRVRRGARYLWEAVM